MHKTMYYYTYRYISTEKEKYMKVLQHMLKKETANR